LFVKPSKDGRRQPDESGSLARHLERERNLPIEVLCPLLVHYRHLQEQHRSRTFRTKVFLRSVESDDGSRGLSEAADLSE
jgi:hypothetical protein